MPVIQSFSAVTRSTLSALGCCNQIWGKSVSMDYNYNSKNLPDRSVSFSLIAERDNLPTVLHSDNWHLKINIQHCGIAHHGRIGQPYSFKNLHPLKLDCEKNLSIYDAQRILEMEFKNPSHMLQAVLKSDKLPNETREILLQMKDAVDANLSYALSNQVGARLSGQGFVPAANSPLLRGPR